MKPNQIIQSNKQIARNAIIKAYGLSRNIMTPNLVEYGLTNGYAWELSWGSGIFSDYLYGVSVVNVMLGTKEPDLSTAFETEAEAREHIINMIGKKGSCPVDPQDRLNCEGCQ